MIDVKAAVRATIDYVREFQEFMPMREIRLEETEFTDREEWEITLSFLDSDTGERSFKLFTVNGESGEIISMKITYSGES